MLGTCDELIERMGVKGFGDIEFKMMLRLLREKRENK